MCGKLIPSTPSVPKQHLLVQLSIFHHSGDQMPRGSCQLCLLTMDIYPLPPYIVSLYPTLTYVLIYSFCFNLCFDHMHVHKANHDCILLQELHAFQFKTYHIANQHLISYNFQKLPTFHHHGLVAPLSNQSPHVCQLIQNDISQLL